MGTPCEWREGLGEQPEQLCGRVAAPGPAGTAGGAPLWWAPASCHRELPGLRLPCLFQGCVRCNRAPFAGALAR